MLNILVVEDEPFLKTIMFTMLSEVGICTWKQDGRSAVEEFKSALYSANPYDLITLDIMMPEMDGKEALKKIREIEENYGITEGAYTKIIMTSAIQDEATIFDSYYQGCEQYLIKPILKTDLLQKIKDLELI
ncbi:MAG: response regulator [Candidatus Cloacimonetes bacterium]|nr:response regulator [Candidatus Cloacimonadota bacterium]